MTASSAPAAAHPAFRLAEKHFKNRATRSLPALRDLPPEICQRVLDLSRPENADDDEVYTAGWWGESYTAAPRNSRRGRGKGKERARGERPELDLAAEGVERVVLADGKVGYVVSEGKLRTWSISNSRLRPDPKLPLPRPANHPPAQVTGRVHPPAQPPLPIDTLRAPRRPVRNVRP